MEDPMDRLMDHVEEQATAAEQELSADGLRRSMAVAVDLQRIAALVVLNAQDMAKAQRETLEFVEAMAIDEWIGATPEADRKRVVGSNEEERRRNTLLMLARTSTVGDTRTSVQVAERAAAIAQIRLEQAQERVRNLRSIAWAFGGECLRGFEPVEDRWVKRDRALPAELLAGRAGLKLVRDTDDF